MYEVSWKVFYLYHLAVNLLISQSHLPWCSKMGDSYNVYISSNASIPLPYHVYVEDHYCCCCCWYSSKHGYLCMDQPWVRVSVHSAYAGGTGNQGKYLKYWVECWSTEESCCHLIFRISHQLLLRHLVYWLVSCSQYV